MKTSNILLSIAAILVLIWLNIPALTGKITLTDKGTPVNGLSKFWQDKYDIALHREIQNTMKHIKIIGDTDHYSRIYLNLYPISDSTKARPNKLFSESPQNFSYKTVKDTLILTVKGYANINIHHREEISSITGVNNCYLTLGKLQQRDVDISADNKSTVRFYPGQSDKRFHMNNMTVKASNGSKIELIDLKADKISAQIMNGLLEYDSSVSIDTLNIKLAGKSSVRTLSEENATVGLKNLIISGDKTYFKPDFVGKGVTVVSR